jgi:N-acetylmuramoyl-L-alanine amidase
MALRVLLLILAFLTAAAMPAAPAFADVVIASDARIVGDEQRTRLIVDLSDGVEVVAFPLADPYRIVIDLPEVAFRLPEGIGGEARGLISGWRYGLFARGKSRIVIDATGPVAVDSAFVLPAIEAQPARLVIDLVGSTREEFLAAQARAALAGSVSEAALSRSDRLPIGPEVEREIPLVVIDPGHGGIDAGATGATGAAEKDVVLALAMAFAEQLRATGRVEVLMTREDDTFVALGDRVQIARDHQADLFVSIHADSIGQDTIRGATIYTLSEEASDREAALLAEKENSSDIVAGLHLEEEPDEIADILIDLTRRETKNFSILFANDLIDEIASATRLISNPHRYAGFRVLRAPDVPSVLIELGYLSNVEDEQLLASDEWRQRMAEALTASVVRFFGPRYAGLGQ